MSSTRKRSKTMIEKPMNPYAAEDFASAIKEASAKLGEDLKRVGEQMTINAEKGAIPFIDFADMGEEYSGVMRLLYSPGGAWLDIFNVLATNGYAVSATIEPPTETEKELDGVKPYIVIAFEEVE